MELIPFNVPFLSGKETEYILDAVNRRVLSGNGHYGKLCHAMLAESTQCKKALLTPSCTDALEMSAMLCDIKAGDEVIMPSYTFVSTANAFVMFGAKPVFVDSRSDHPGLDEDQIEELITPKTRAIVPVHYAGVACDMDKIMDIAKRHKLRVIEDAAQAIDATYKGRPLGGIGDLGALSFHETKNIQSGEGGALLIGNEELEARAEIIWEKGTNRSAFWRGEVDKYGWVDKGASFLMSEVCAAFLYAQLESMRSIQQMRIDIWNLYHQRLADVERSGHIRRPVVPDYASNNAHMYYIVLDSSDARDRLLKHLRERKVYSVFHYLSLGTSPYYSEHYGAVELRNSEKYTDGLLRLPLYPTLETNQVHYICDLIEEYYR